MITPFLPAKDYELSKQFYAYIGFSLGDETTDESRYTECILEDNVFILQDYYVVDWAENTMLTITVPNLDEFLTLLQASIENKNPFGIKVKGPLDAGYGRQLHLLDPSGILWHVFEKKS
jgi:predicted lactoylglutathione lyase